MKRIFIYLIFIIPVIVSCTYKKRQSDLSVYLEVIRKADCNNFCYQLKVSFKNNTDKKVYITNLHLPEHLFIIDSSGCNVFNDYLKEEIDYYREHVTPRLIDSELVEYDGKIEMKYDTNEISHKRLKEYYNTFTEDATNLEMSGLMKINKQLLKNIDCQKYLKDLLKSKYSQIILLEPNGLEYELYNINTLFKEKNEFKVFFNYNNLISPNGIEIIIPESNGIIELKGDRLENVDGYSLFAGKLNSDTIIIKND